MLIEPPPCPPWCAAHGNNQAWDVSPVDTTRTCRRVIEVEGRDGQSHEIALERFAALVGDGGALHIDDAIVRLDGGDAMSLDNAQLLSDCLRRVVELADEASLAA